MISRLNFVLNSFPLLKQEQQYDKNYKIVTQLKFCLKRRIFLTFTNLIANHLSLITANICKPKVNNEN